MGDVHVACRIQTVGDAVLTDDTAQYSDRGHAVFRTVCIVAMELPPFAHFDKIIV